MEAETVRLCGCGAPVLPPTLKGWSKPRFCPACAVARANHQSNYYFDAQSAEWAGTEALATQWLEASRWPRGRVCPHCRNGVLAPVTVTGPLPWRCGLCHGYATVFTSTPMGRTNLSARQWARAIILLGTLLDPIRIPAAGAVIPVTLNAAKPLFRRIDAAVMAAKLPSIYLRGSELDAVLDYKPALGRRPGVMIRRPPGLTPHKLRKIMAPPVRPPAAPTWAPRLSSELDRASRSAP